MVKVQDALGVFLESFTEQSPETSSSIAQPDDCFGVQNPLSSRFQPQPRTQVVYGPQYCHQSPLDKVSSLLPRTRAPFAQAGQNRDLGLAPLWVQEIFRVSADLRERGMTILLVKQNARAALDLADRAYVMESGQVVLGGVADDLACDERVQTAYLGKVR